VGARPVADARQIGTERIEHTVVGIADEDGPVADLWRTRNVLEHLGVVVGR
jgi:hypothetical protein